MGTFEQLELFEKTYFLENIAEVENPILKKMKLKEMKKFFLEFPDVFKFYLEHHCKADVSELLVYHKIINLEALCRRPHLWTNDTLENYKDILDWALVCGAGEFPDATEFITKFEERIDWFFLSINQHFEWNASLLDTYKERIDWSTICYNLAIRWDKQLIYQFADKWHYTHLLRRNDIPWDDELLEFMAERYDKNEPIEEIDYPTFEALELFLPKNALNRSNLKLSDELFIPNPGTEFCAEVFKTIEEQHMDFEEYNNNRLYGNTWLATVDKSKEHYKRVVFEIEKPVATVGRINDELIMRGLNLLDYPPFFSELDEVRNLDLSNNHLGTVSSLLAKLKIRELNLLKNNLYTFPYYLDSFHDLRVLRITIFKFNSNYEKGCSSEEVEYLIPAWLEELELEILYPENDYPVELLPPWLKKVVLHGKCFTNPNPPVPNYVRIDRVFCKMQ